MLQSDQVMVIGTGLLGTSIALGLKAAGYGGELVGVGRRPATLEAARARGAFDRVLTDLADAMRDGALVIVAVPLGAFAETFDTIAATGRAAVVTDVGSTKASVVREAQARLRADQPFVGSHPMAGSEHRGPDAADATLCLGKPCIVTVDAHAPAAAVETVESLWTTLGMTLLRMSPDEHDLQVAAISHLPHLMSVMLVKVAEQMGGWDIASTGFRDTTRLASSNPPMRADIIEANRSHVVATLNALGAVLDEVKAKVELGEQAALLTLLESAKARRDTWLASHESCQPTRSASQAAPTDPA